MSKTLKYIIIGLVAVIVVWGFYVLKSRVDKSMAFESGTTVSSQIVAGKPVKWVAVVSKEDLKNGKQFLQLPGFAENIIAKPATEHEKTLALNNLNKQAVQNDLLALVYNKNNSNNYYTAGLLSATQSGIGEMFNKVKDFFNFNLTKKGQNKFYNISGVKTKSDYVTVTYETPAPQITEKAIKNGKEITVRSPAGVDYKNVLAYASLPSVANQMEVQILWKNNNNKKMIFDGYDSKGLINYKVNYVEWTVPHLSDQVFDIILISKASRLDSSRQVTEDIYDTVSIQDNNWATVKDNEWLRFTFAYPVDSTKSIDIYAKPTNPNQAATIEIYRQNSEQLIASININKEYYYHVSMANLGDNPEDVFDFKIKGNVDIDYVQDAASVTISTGTDSGGTWTGGSFSCAGVNVINTTTLTGKLNAYSSVSITCGTTTVSNNITWSTGGHTLSIAGSTLLNLSANITGPGDIIFPTGSGIKIGGATNNTVTIDTSSGNGNFSTSSNIQDVGTTHSLAINTGSGGIYIGLIGSTAPIPSLTLTTSGAVTINANITTNGANGVDLSACSNSITLGNNVAIDTSAGNGPVNFGTATLNGAQTLSVNAGSGAITFGGVVGGVTPIKTLSATSSGGIILSGGGITLASGYSPTFTGPVSLYANTTINTSGSNTVSFSSIINGAYTFTVNAATGTATFGGSIGGISPIKTFAVTASTAININGGGARTAAGYDATFTGPAVLGANTIISTAGTSTMNFTSTINGAKTLTISGVSGTTATFGGVIGGSTPIQTLAVTAGTAINLNGGGITLASGYSPTFTGPVMLGADTVFSVASGSNSPTFTSTINGAHSLSINNGSTVTFGGVVGGSTPIQTLAVTASTAINLNGGGITLASGYGATFTGAVVLGSYASVTTSGTNTVSFSSYVNGAYTFSVSAGASGTVTFTRAIGASSALSSLDVYAGTAINLNNISSNTITASGHISFAGPVNLGANLTVATTNSAVSFSSTIDGAKTLTINTGTGSTVTFGGTIGGSTPIQTLSVTSSGGINLNGGGITLASGYSPTFTGPVYLGASTTITTSGSNAVHFTSTINGAQSFAINAGASGTIAIDGAVGGTPLGAITITNCSSGTFSSTINAASYANTNGNVTMADNVILTGGLNIGAGTLIAPSTGKSITLSGNWTNSGTFDARLGTVIFNGSNQTISGANNFYNLTAITPDQIIVFPQGYITTITHTLTLEGSSGHNILLKSDEAGTDGSKAHFARIDVNAISDNHGHSYFQYVKPYDNNASNGNAQPIQTQNSTNGGNNLGWSFGGNSSAMSIKGAINFKSPLLIQ